MRACERACVRASVRACVRARARAPVIPTGIFPVGNRFAFTEENVLRHSLATQFRQSIDPKVGVISTEFRQDTISPLSSYGL